MANPQDVTRLLTELHNQKIVNLDTSIRAVMEPESLRALDPGATVAAAIIAWDGYGLVIKNQAVDISQIQAVASTIANVMRGSAGSAR